MHDLTANLLGLTQVAILATTGLVAWSLRRRGHWAAGILSGIGTCVLLTAIVAPIFAHACENGQAVLEIAIPAFCSGFLVGLTGGSGPAICLALFYFGAGCMMTGPYNGLVHTGRYTGNPSHERAMPAIVARSLLRSARRGLEGASPDQTVPPGWLSESPLVSRGIVSASAVYFRSLTYHTVRVRRVWHTPLTGLYRKERDRRYALWTPGGPAPEAIARLEWRETSAR